MNESAPVRNNPAQGFIARALASLNRHPLLWIGALAAIGLILRLLLALNAPFPFGYIHDFYHRGVMLLYTTGKIPGSDDCMQCYHPPLLFILGQPFLWLGMLLTGGRHHQALKYVCLLPMLCGLLTMVYAYRILRLLKYRGSDLVLAMALALVFPCLFISSWGIESDILLTAIMTVFLYALIRYDRHPGRAGWKQALWLGALCGLAMAAKFQGLIALWVTGMLLGVHLGFRSTRRRTLLHGGLILLVACALGGWKYYDNYQKYGTPLYTQTIAKDGFAVSDRQFHWGYYDLVHLRLGETLALMAPDAPPGDLDKFPVYQSVPTVLHATAWSDMSFFSEPSRHGAPEPMYPGRGVPVALVGAVLVLALLPNALAIVGFFATARRRVYLPVTLFVLATVGIYAFWLVSQIDWSLKSKYVLFLLTPYLVYVIVGFRWISRHSPRAVRWIVGVLLILLIALTHVYLYRFAIGA